MGHVTQATPLFPKFYGFMTGSVPRNIHIALIILELAF